METSVGCGVAWHDDECLCDVVIPHPTGWVGDAVADMWMGHSITMLCEYTQPWDDNSILEYLSDLVYAKDNWARAVAEMEASYEAEPCARWEAQARQYIHDRLHEMENPSIIAVRDEMGYDQEKLCHVLFQSRRYMTEEELEAFEQAVLTSKHSSPDGLATEFNMIYQSAKRLHGYWGTPFYERKRDPALEYMDELIVSMPDARPKEIADLVNARFGEGRMRSNKVSHRRHVLHKKNNM